jgi:pimeloyl-ACP methyl ester carboxylesterase
VILVGGALSQRKAKPLARLAGLLSTECTVVNYDRRGRGDSEEGSPFAVQREIEDLAALIEGVGGRASLWGWSSGGALALRAAQAKIGVERLSIYEVPFAVDAAGGIPPADYGTRLDELVATGDRSGAVRHFMRNAIGLNAPAVGLMRLLPIWKDMKALAHTLPYDWAARSAQRRCVASRFAKRSGLASRPPRSSPTVPRARESSRSARGPWPECCRAPNYANSPVPLTTSGRKR